MFESSVDLGTPLFWAFLVVALVLIMPLRHAGLRWWTIAAVNVGFVAALVGARGAALALVLCGVIYLGCRALGRGALRVPAIWGVGLASAALFLCHKTSFGPAPLKQVLGAIGFSYVALRTVELTRAVYEGAQPAPNLPKTIAYLLPFHMLAAGPIQSYADFAAQPDVSEKLGLRATLDGVELVVHGLFKKFVLAHAIDAVLLTHFHQGGAYFLLELQAFYLWVYLDFSAYSDIALGIGRLLGIATPRNFDRPLSSRNLIEFWERWHISLSQFIRNNVFIPLQLLGMRATDGARPLLIASLAFSASFLLCGLWHALSLKFLSWGAMHAFGLVVCNAYKHTLRKRLGRAGVAAYMQRPVVRWLATALTFEYVALSLAFVAYPFQGYFR